MLPKRSAPARPKPPCHICHLTHRKGQDDSSERRVDHCHVLLGGESTARDRAPNKQAIGCLSMRAYPGEPKVHELGVSAAYFPTPRWFPTSKTNTNFR